MSLGPVQRTHFSSRIQRFLLYVWWPGGWMPVVASTGRVERANWGRERNRHCHPRYHSCKRRASAPGTRLVALCILARALLYTTLVCPNSSALLGAAQTQTLPPTVAVPAECPPVTRPYDAAAPDTPLPPSGSHRSRPASTPLPLDRVKAAAPTPIAVRAWRSGARAGEAPRGGGGAPSGTAARSARHPPQPATPAVGTTMKTRWPTSPPLRRARPPQGATAWPAPLPQCSAARRRLPRRRLVRGPPSPPCGRARASDARRAMVWAVWTTRACTTMVGTGAVLAVREAPPPSPWRLAVATSRQNGTRLGLPLTARLAILTLSSPCVPFCAG